MSSPRKRCAVSALVSEMYSRPGASALGRQQRGHQPLGRLGLRERLHLAGERLVVGPLGLAEVERQVVDERDLEERLARAAVVAEPAQELARLPVVADRLPVGVDRPRAVARPDQVLGRLGGVVGGREVAREQRERAGALLVAAPAPRAPRRRGRAAPWRSASVSLA